jgi:hypothetical protein
MVAVAEVLLCFWTGSSSRCELSADVKVPQLVRHLATMQVDQYQMQHRATEVLFRNS